MDTLNSCQARVNCEKSVCRHIESGGVEAVPDETETDHLTDECAVRADRYAQNKWSDVRSDKDAGRFVCG